MRGLATAVAAPMVWMVFAVAFSLFGVPGVGAPLLAGLLSTMCVFAVASFGVRARRDHAEV